LAFGSRLHEYIPEFSGKIFYSVGVVSPGRKMAPKFVQVRGSFFKIVYVDYY
jgi:hypothetical protein